jgi:SagB-type dehydrogenase family enzyme
MVRRVVSIAVVALPLLLSAVPVGAVDGQAVALPKPDLKGKVTLERAITERRSVREYAPGPLALADVSQLMWAAQGITSADGKKRAVPSARAVYPIQVWLLAMDVTGLPAGIYRYEPQGHALAPMKPGDPRAALVAATPRQAMMETAAAVVAVVGDSVLATEKFGPNTARWLGMEAGFAVQEVYLMATARGLGTVMVGGFQPALVAPVLGLPDGWVPLGLMPLGRRK